MEESRILQFPDYILHIHIKLCCGQLTGAHAIGQGLVACPWSRLASPLGLLPLPDVVEAVGAVPGAHPTSGLGHGVGPQGRILKSSGVQQFIVGMFFH